MDDDNILKKTNELDHAINEGDSEVIAFLIDYFENDDGTTIQNFPSLLELLDEFSASEGIALEEPYSTITITDILKHVLFMCEDNAVEDVDTIIDSINDLAHNLPYNSN